MAETFFTSDTHYGHKNIIKYTNRPYTTSNEMDEALITNHNAIVGPNDIVYHLGDFAFGDVNYIRYLFSRLNGFYRIIFGNHDKGLRQYKKYAWNSRKVQFLGDMADIEVNGQQIILCHYPILSWQDKGRGAWMIHGHCHYNLLATRKDSNLLGKILDVGLEGNDYHPYSFDNIKNILNKKDLFGTSLDLNDHHTVKN
jgi:calcineurin-like phosphoesterase family protein